MASLKSISAAQQPIKPFLRWAGSKRKLLSRLKGYWSPDRHKRYIEPFAGSACLFFELRPRAAILGDSNRELIDLYRAVKADPKPIFERLVRIPRNAETYYRWRAKNPRTEDRATRALRFLYLNRNCFNGIYRTNTDGGFNVPFGGKHGQPCGALARQDFMRAAKELKNARFVAGDFSRTLAVAEKGDFVYLDPPFAVSSRRVFTEYGEKIFDVTDVDRLARELRRLHKLGAEFLVSYADCTAARKLAQEWNASKLYVRRHIAGFTGDRRMASEWLITNLASHSSEA
jgi:DNA adenine methylase